MSKLEALSRSLRQGAQNEAGLAGLDEQYAAANKLANTQTARPDRFGRTSGLAVLNDVIGRAQGGNKLRELAPQREAARQGLAETKFALPLYQAGVDAAKVTQDQQNVDNKTSALVQAAALANQNRQGAATQQNTWGVENAATATGVAEDVAAVRTSALVQSAAATAKAKAAQEQSKRDREDQKSPLVTKISPDGKERTIRYNAQTGIGTLDGEVIPNLSKWTDPAKKTVNVERGSYGGKTNDKKSEAYLDAINRVDDVFGLMTKVTPEQEALMNSPMHQAKMAGIKALTPEAFETLVESQFSGYDAATKDMLISLNAMGAEERKRLFGAALTDNERKDSKAFLAATMGRGLPWIRSALEGTKRTNTNALLRVDGMYGGDTYRTMLTGLGAIPEGYAADVYELGNAPEMGSALQIPAPEGVDAAEWGEYSPEQQAAWKATFGGGAK